MPYALTLQSFYEPTISSASGIAGTGDVSFDVSIAPTNSKGFIVANPSNVNLREIMFYHNVVGNTIYVREVNRGLGGTSMHAHAQGDVIAMKDVAQIFNHFSDNLSQCFFVEKTGGLNITVWGGNVFYNGSYQTVADTNLTLSANTTNYVHYDYPTNLITVDTTDASTTKAIIVTNATGITSITQKVAKESFIDFTVALTGALPSQTGNAGKSLMTDGTNVSWGTNNNYRTGLGASLKNIEVNTAGNEVATTVSTATSISVTETIRKRTADLTYADVPYSAILQDAGTSFSGIAGETIAANDAVYKETVSTFLANYTTSVPSAGVNIGDIAANTRQSMRVIGNGSSFSTLKMGLNKAGAPGDNCIVRIETDSSGAPSGTLVNANATSTISGASLSTGTSEVTVTFAGSFSITAGTVAHIVIQRSGANDPANHYQIPVYVRRVRGFTTQSFNASWGSANTNASLGVICTGIYSSIFCKTDGTYLANSSYVGICSAGGATGSAIIIQPGGLVGGLSGLTPDAPYYISNTAGTISTTPGTFVKMIGVAKSATELNMLIPQDNPSRYDNLSPTYITIFNTAATFKQWIAEYPTSVIVTTTGTSVILRNQTAQTSGVAFNVVPGDIVSMYGGTTITFGVLQRELASGLFMN